MDGVCSLIFILPSIFVFFISCGIILIDFQRWELFACQNLNRPWKSG